MHGSGHVQIEANAGPSAGLGAGQRALPKILLVDDNPNNLHVLRELLVDLKTELLTATGGNEALGIIASEAATRELALVLLDVQMPDIDGLEVARLMRQNEMTRSLPIVFITAFAADDAHTFKGYELGAVDYIHKPIRAEVLRGKVNVLLDLHRQRRDIERQNEELESFARSVAHDLRSPLRQALMFCNVFLEDCAAELGQNCLDDIMGMADSLSVTATPTDKTCTVAVCDNGIGIPAERAEEIFEPFRRLPPREQFQGSGLGLATCAKLVNRMGGEIWVESTPGDGSTFYFTLPLG